MHCPTVCSFASERHYKLCLPKSLFTLEMILLHELAVDTTAWTLPSVEHLLTSFTIKEGSCSTLDPGGRQTGVENRWPRAYDLLP